LANNKPKKKHKGKVGRSKFGASSNHLPVDRRLASEMITKNKSTVKCYKQKKNEDEGKRKANSLAEQKNIKKKQKNGRRMEKADYPLKITECIIIKNIIIINQRREHRYY
jgi:hypothetical protein